MGEESDLRFDWNTLWDLEVLGPPSSGGFGVPVSWFRSQVLSSHTGILGDI